MASPTSDAFDRPAVERLAAALLAGMALLAVLCVALGLGAQVLARGAMAGAWATRFFAWGRDAIVLAPLVSLLGVALRAFRGQRRLAWFALAALVVTLVGMGLAR